MNYRQEALLKIILKPQTARFLIALATRKRTGGELAQMGIRGVSVSALLLAGIVEKERTEEGETVYSLTEKGLPLASALKTLMEATEDVLK